MATIIKVLANGPLQVTGEVQVQDATGKPLPVSGESIYLCRCGASGNKPFCDGTHKRIGFSA